MVDFARRDVALLLRRTGFFSAPDDVDALMDEPSWSAVVDRVLDTSANPPDTTPAVVADPATPVTQAVLAASEYWMDRMVTSPTPIVEKMTFFWHGVLVSAVVGDSMPELFAQIATWRRLGLGDAHELVQAMAIDPAMLDYLDNARNVKGAPNENFARELMELFTMGNATFTENDVIEVARAWTGHNLVGRSYAFRSNRHDDGQKTIFGITRNWDGPEVITEILRGSKQTVSARYLAGRIWSAFAAPNPTPPLLDALTQAFIDVDLDLTEFLRIVFERPEFRTDEVRTGLVRSPVEWEVAVLRATGLAVTDLNLAAYQQQMGQVLYLPPNVSGWRQNRAWISSSASWAKGSVAAGLVTPMGTSDRFADLAAMDVAGAVGTLLDRFGIDEPSAATRTRLEAYLAGERNAGRAASATATLVAVATLTPDFQLA